MVRLRRDEGSIETPDGKMLAAFMRQGQAGGKQLVLIGIREEDKFHVKIDGGRIERRLQLERRSGLAARNWTQLFAAKSKARRQADLPPLRPDV